jgi:hypothetical protein
VSARHFHPRKRKKALTEQGFLWLRGVEPIIFQITPSHGAEPITAKLARILAHQTTKMLRIDLPMDMKKALPRQTAGL